MILFFAVILLFTFITAIAPKRDFSELENTYLASPPKLSLEKLLNGEFESDAEDYIADHFFGRDSLLKFKTYANIAMNKHERNDVYITETRLAEKVGEPNWELMEKTLNGISVFAADNSDKAVYFMLAPTSGDIYYEEMPKNAPMLDEKSFIEDIYGRLPETVTPIDVYSTLSVNKDKYIYYRTDHHWTTCGAYLSYIAAAKKMGITPVTLDNYNIEHASDGFLGTLYSKALYDGIKPDVIDYYHPKNACEIKGEYVYTTFEDEPVFYDDIYFREYLDTKDKYSSITGKNNPMVKLVSDSSGGHLLIIKDSYAHSIAPFFLQNYSEVTMLDMRYINVSYKDVIDMDDYDSVLFVYNVSNFISDENLKNLSY